MSEKGFDYYGRKLEHIFANGFYNYGVFVGKHPNWFFFGSLICVLLSLPGYTYISLNLDLYKLFVPPDAPVKTEFERQQIFNTIPQGDLDFIPPARIAKNANFENFTNKMHDLVTFEKKIDRSKRGKKIFFSKPFCVCALKIQKT